MTILYIIIAFLSGFLIAWLIKKASVVKEQVQDLEALKRGAALETEKNIVVSNNAALQLQVEKLQEQLRAISSEASGKDAKIEAEINNIALAKEQFQKLEQRFNEAMNSINSLDKQKSYLDAELKYKNEQLANQKAELENIGKKFETEFKVLAQNILNEKTQAFNEHQEKSLAEILKPLRDNIDSFKREIGARYDVENNERISLKEQIKIITETNKLLSDQANNLTNALRGQVKQQGNWGEMILESILDYSGLTRDLHYFTQERIYNEEGQAFLPDIIVKYPDGRNIVIDSKVSLLHYEEYCSSKDIVEQDKYLQLLINSVYAHINSLSSKEYQQKINALDFVMLFIPVEGAYITAMQNDMEMWRYAYNKKVLLISPTNLIPAMKLVYDLWKKDDINKDAQLIAGKAVKIYEKLAAFVEDFEKVGAQLQKATAVFNDAGRKLYTGKGNLIAQASQMKARLKHDKPNRELPASMEEQAAVEDEMPDEINEPPL
ncbi:DNA recombination protein RmuC [Ginsengibacter hankyongi]|uniref:DNA recombination protein RmuC n=1 Tax=Ginsengibacter hankyongi TaxID=2607284 RepID=A0A5J5IF54_9BACT|nr:DNA recombination protein RmuC [Ginsengibacter hankyongi]KAA9037227.1 DNA recombination protein RmuC [Ginsengibacter hankyongi]